MHQKAFQSPEKYQFAPWSHFSLIRLSSVLFFRYKDMHQPFFDYYKILHVTIKTLRKSAFIGLVEP